MIWIELIGPSGVGKSYWYSAFLKKYPSLDPQTILLKRVYEKRKEMQFPFKVKLFFLLYHLHLPKLSFFFKIQLYHYLLAKYQPSLEQLREDEEIAKQYLESVQKYKEPQKSILEKISYFALKLREFRMYESYFDKEDIYLAEDGLLHLSPVYCKALQPDLAIVLSKNKDVVIMQRKERAKTQPRLVERLLEGQALDDYVTHYYTLYTQKIESLESDSKITVDLNKGLALQNTYDVIKTQFLQHG